MSYASQAGRARVNARNPQAQSLCQRCGIWHNFVDLQWQHDWRGNALQNTRLLVCHNCLDRPQEQLRAIVVPADPLPVPFSIVEPFVYDETTGPTAPYGAPVGLQQAGIMPLNNGVAYGVPLSVLSVTANGTTTIAVTCSTAHGLSTNSQVSVLGLTKNGATGFYSVVVNGAMSFTYTTYAAVPSGALLTPTTRIVTALVGLPLGQTTIPQVAP